VRILSEGGSLGNFNVDVKAIIEWLIEIQAVKMLIGFS
jgi:hypothetical protein